MNRSAMQVALDDLVEVTANRRELNALECERITAARQAGASWERIASALGIRSRQGAEQRYHRLMEVEDT